MNPTQEIASNDHEAFHLLQTELEAGLPDIRKSPADRGILRLIVRRPSNGEREVVQEAMLDLTEGLMGDNWKVRGSKTTPDGSANPEFQVTATNARVISLLARNKERWPLAGDQLYIDLDLSETNLPVGSRLAIGETVLEVTPPPHTGCKKFQARFGAEALNFINNPEGKQRKMRGIHLKVVQPGRVRVGDAVIKV